MQRKSLETPGKTPQLPAQRGRCAPSSESARWAGQALRGSLGSAPCGPDLAQAQSRSGRGAGLCGRLRPRRAGFPGLRRATGGGGGPTLLPKPVIVAPERLRRGKNAAARRGLALAWPGPGLRRIRGAGQLGHRCLRRPRPHCGAPSLLPCLPPSLTPSLPPSYHSFFHQSFLPSLPPTHPPSFPPSLFFLSLPHPGLRPWPKPNPATPDWGFFCAPTSTLPGVAGWVVKVLGPALDLWVP